VVKRDFKEKQMKNKKLKNIGISNQLKKTVLLSLASLVQGKNKIHLSIPAEDLATNKTLKILGNANVEILLLRSGDKLFLNGFIDFQAEINCAICAENFIKDFSEPIRAEYIKQSLKLGRSTLLTRDEIDRFYYEDDSVDLLPLFHDTVLLAIPLAPICREECRGICPGCGVNLNSEVCQCEKVSIEQG
jgi:uncharacterized protein